jgi:integrase
MDFVLNGKRINRSTKTTNKSVARKVEKAERNRVILADLEPDAPGALLSERVLSMYYNKWQMQAGGEQCRKQMEVVLDIFGNINVAEIDRPKLKWLRRKLADGRTQTTVNRYMQTLRSVLIDAQRDGLLNRVPHFDMAPEPKVKTIVNTLSEDAERHLLNVADDLMRDIITVALDTGLRLSEVLGLTGSHVTGDAIVLQAEDTKSGNARVVPITDRAFEILESRMRLVAEDDYLFKSWSGRQLTGPNVSKAFTELRDRAGISNKVTFHCLRHTFATRWLETNGNIRKLQVILGHASITTTERYTHVCLS